MPPAATTPRKRAAKAPAATAAPTVVPDDFLRIQQDMTTTTVVERDLVVRLAILAALANGNLHLLGPAGIAKSLVLREFGKRLVNDDGTPAVVFERQMDEETTADDLLGPIDFPRLTNDGVLVRKTDGKIGGADLVFIDELTRSSQPARNLLLPIMNTGERIVEIDGVRQRAPMLGFFSASNHMPDVDDGLATAFVDRMGFLLNVERIRLEDNFKEMLTRASDRQRQNGSFHRETMTLAQVREAQRQVTLVDLTPSFLDAVASLRASCIGEALPVSDRRWVEIVALCRAGAWMAGRDHLIDEDLAIAEYAIPRDPEHFAKAHELVMPYHGRFEREAAEKRAEAAEPIARWQAVRPKVESTPPTEDIEPDALKETISVRRRIDECARRVAGVLEEAAKQNREAADLRALANELKAIQDWFDAMGFPSR